MIDFEFSASSYRGVPWEEEHSAIVWSFLRHMQRVKPGRAANILLQDHVRHSVGCAIHFSDLTEEAGVSLH